MRKIFFLICLLSSLCAMAQKTIIMEQDAGVYKIPCKVNGAKMKMIFDTGAASVSISLQIAEYLYENDLLKAVFFAFSKSWRKNRISGLFYFCFILRC